MSLFIQGLLLGKHLTLSVETTLLLRPSVSVADSERVERQEMRCVSGFYRT